MLVFIFWPLSVQKDPLLCLVFSESSGSFKSEQNLGPLILELSLSLLYTTTRFRRFLRLKNARRYGHVRP